MTEGQNLTALVERWARVLLGRQRRQLSLNEIGEVIGTDPATPAAIEALFAQLEAHGIEVEATATSLPSDNLSLVLRVARELRGQGISTSIDNLVSATGLSRDQVRGALLFAQMLQR